VVLYYGYVNFTANSTAEVRCPTSLQACCGTVSVRSSPQRISHDGKDNFYASPTVSRGLFLGPVANKACWHSRRPRAGCSPILFPTTRCTYDSLHLCLSNRHARTLWHTPVYAFFSRLASSRDHCRSTLLLICAYAPPTAITMWANVTQLPKMGSPNSASERPAVYRWWSGRIQ
jgi:hypothetical protein